MLLIASLSSGKPLTPKMQSLTLLALAICLALLSLTQAAIQVQNVQISNNEDAIHKFVPSLELHIVKNEKITFQLADVVTEEPTGKSPFQSF